MKPKYGLRLTIDAEWVASEGYRPVRATVAATKPANFERTLTIQLECHPWWGGGGGGSRVEQELVLPAGAVTAQTIISTPCFGNWGRMSSTVLVNGWPVREMGSDIPAGGFGGSGNAGPVRTLIVGPANQPVANFAPLRGILANVNVNQVVNQAMGQVVNGNLITNNNGTPVVSLPALVNVQDNVVIRPASNLSTKWIDYTCLDLIYVPASELPALSASTAWEPILRWTATGGNLAIEASQLDADLLDGIDKSFAKFLFAQQDPTAPWIASRAAIDWPAFDPGDVSWQTQLQLGPAAIAQTAAQVAANALAQSQGQGGATLPGSKYLWRPQGLGLILLLEADSDGEPLDGRVVVNSPIQDPSWSRFSWVNRNGFSSQEDSEAFWWHLVPGVGLPPVAMFCVLITAFAVVIGPVNYFFLRRRGRLYLLLITVPASAALVTLLLIGYAIASDGLASRVRVRSYTLLDQKQGNAVCWSWLSYYCGLSPGEGLNFPDDVAVFPLGSEAPGNSGWGGSRGPVRHLEWSDTQRMPRGWLAARTPTQYVISRSRSTMAKIKFDAPRQPQQAENQLGTHLKLLVLLDHDDEYRAAADIPPGASGELNVAPAPEALRQLAKYFNAAIPQAPPEIPAPKYGSFRGPVGTWNSQFEGGLLEQAMQAICPPHAAQALPLERGSYVAIVASSPEVVVGLDADEEASFHVIQGTW